VSNPTNLTTVSVTNLQTYGHFCLVKSPSGNDYAFLRHYDTMYGDYGVNIADINDKKNPVNTGYIPDDSGGHTRDLCRCHWMQCTYNNITHNWVLYVIGYMDNSWVTFNITFGTSIPVANFTYDVKELNVMFNASSSYDPDGTIVSWHWEFGDNTEDVGEVITHRYPATGTYDVTLMVTDNDGINNSITKRIAVEELNFQKVFIFGKITNISTQGEYITFDAVRIGIAAFFPFNFTIYLSGENFTIAKEYRGFVGARFIFSLCNRLL
jgi:PKD repeat protein